ncbi:hypothetical protein [Pelistega sp. MC2]|uniref:hypothetical protein n=1 Tax=Pelistega sp. MC2 TaxID=1720297 RepID=UPI0008DAD5E9|nr:hypothetical protein [Pelistega sp. MC2]
MDKRYVIRRENLRRLIDKLANGIDAQFAEKYGYTRSRIGQFLSENYNNGKSIGDRAARTLEKALDLEPLTLDQEIGHIPITSWPFSITYEQYMSLSEQDKKELDVLMSLKFNTKK